MLKNNSKHFIIICKMSNLFKIELWVWNLCPVDTDSHIRISPRLKKYFPTSIMIPQEQLFEATDTFLEKSSNGTHSSSCPETCKYQPQTSECHSQAVPSNFIFEMYFPWWREKAADLPLWVEELGYMPPFYWPIIVRRCRHSATINYRPSPGCISQSC